MEDEDLLQEELQYEAECEARASMEERSHPDLDPYQELSNKELENHLYEHREYIS